MGLIKDLVLLPIKVVTAPTRIAAEIVTAPLGGLKGIKYRNCSDISLLEHCNLDYRSVRLRSHLGDVSRYNGVFGPSYTLSYYVNGVYNSVDFNSYSKLISYCKRNGIY